MATGQGNSRSVEDWKRGILQLKKLECKFIAFYGAEPLYDFDKLPEVVGFAESEGIDTTVISSGVVDNFYDKLSVLHSKGARSLSMSYDVVPIGEGSRIKSQRALAGLSYFQNLGCRDVAAIATLTKKNHKHIFDAIKMLSSAGIWFFFDLIHPDLGHPGSKCKLTEDAKKLLFEHEDVVFLINTLKKVVKMKSEGYLCHTTENFVKTLISLYNRHGSLYSWCCADYEEFPSWVTINPDGSVFPCDDFQPPTDKTFDMLTIAEDWEEFSDTFRKLIHKYRCTCCWNTHIDAHGVKTGQLQLGDYVHGK